MDIVCPYGGIQIPLLKKQDILGEIVRAQVVHRVIFRTFFPTRLQIFMTLTEKSVMLTAKVG